MKTVKEAQKVCFQLMGKYLRESGQKRKVLVRQDERIRNVINIFDDDLQKSFCSILNSVNMLYS